MTYLFIDTEGIGSIQESQTHDAKIFALAILLSSYFIYNSMGVIDESALDRLSCITNLTKHIQISSSMSADQNAANFSNFFPQFLWVVRDFGLQLIDEKQNRITPKEYLENALRKTSGNKYIKSMRIIYFFCQLMTAKTRFEKRFWKHLTAEIASLLSDL
jgi:hypothetical protein